MSKNPSPDFSRYLNNGGYKNISLSYYQNTAPSLSTSPSIPSIVKVSVNKTLPSSLTYHSSLQKAQSTPALLNPLSARKKTSSIAKSASIKAALSKFYFFFKLAFVNLRFNKGYKLRQEGTDRLGKLIMKGRVRRLDSGFYELFRNSKRRKRLEVFIGKLDKLYNKYLNSRQKLVLNKLFQYDNKKLAKQIKSDNKNKLLNFTGMIKRLQNKRGKLVINTFKEFIKLYRQQGKYLKKLAVIFKNVYNRNILSSFHKLSIAKKPVKLQKTSRSLSKSIKTEEKQQLIVAPVTVSKQFEEKCNLLESDLKKTKNQLKLKEQSLRQTQTQKSKLQQQIEIIASRVITFQEQNKSLSTKLTTLQLQRQQIQKQRQQQRQKNLRLSRNSSSSYRHFCQDQHYDDDKQQHQNKSVNSHRSNSSKKSIISNLSSKSFVQNASMMSFNTMYLLKKLAGKHDPLKQTHGCCEYKDLFMKMQNNYKDIHDKYDVLNDQYDLLKEQNKTLNLQLESNLIDLNGGDEVEKVKKENLELRAQLQSYKVQSVKMKEEKDKMKKEFKKKLEDIYFKVTKKKSAEQV